MSNTFKTDLIAVTKCYTDATDKLCGTALSFEKGSGNLENFNSSFNDCHHIGTLRSLTDGEHVFRYINAYKENVSYSVLIQAQASKNCQISNVNIANNYAGDSIGMIRSCVGSNLHVENCISMNNVAPFEFYCDEDQSSLILRNYCCDYFRCYGNVQNFSANQCINDFKSINLEYLCFRTQSVRIEENLTYFRLKLILFVFVIGDL